MPLQTVTSEEALHISCQVSLLNRLWIKEHMERNIAMARIFAAPYTVVIDNLGDPRTAGERVGLTAIGTEMAGGGIARTDVLSTCKHGVQNRMIHLGILQGDQQGSTVVEEKILRLPGAKGFVFASIESVFEPFHELGEKISAGQDAGLVHKLGESLRVAKSDAL
jgi:hypothetical protein